MTDKSTRTRPRGRTYMALALAGLLAVLITAIAASAADQQSAKAVAKATDARTIGGTGSAPKPLCPQRPSETHKPPPTSGQIKHACQVVGHVTGFQQMAQGKRHAFVAPKSGKIVAWAVSVARPNHFESKAFGSQDFFGTKALGGIPSARLAVLKKQPKSHMKLMRQSATVDLTSAEGRKQFFTVKKPLKIKKGQIVGLTMQTWAPVLAFSKKIAKNNSWRASRHSGKCQSSNANQNRQLAIDARPQTKQGSVRQYGCTYTGRILYWAYYVPNA